MHPPRRHHETFSAPSSLGPSPSMASERNEPMLPRMPLANQSYEPESGDLTWGNYNINLPVSTGTYNWHLLSSNSIAGSNPQPHGHGVNPAITSHERRSASNLFITKELLKGSVTVVLVRGGFGWIRKGRLKDGQSVAIKVLQPRDLKVPSVEKSRRFRNEVTIWSKLRHKNVLPFYGLADLSEHNIFETGLVSPWMEYGNCNDYFERYPHDKRLPMIQGILNGLTYLHDRSIVHGDLRGANVLVTMHGNPLLSDFGLAVVVEDLAKMSISSVLQGSGNCRWMAIEVLIYDKNPTTKSDMWALGMVILELFTGKPPFSAAKNDAQVVLALNAKKRPLKPSPEANKIGFSDALWDIVQRCWDDDEDLRPSAFEIFAEITPLPESDIEQRLLELYGFLM